MKPAHVVVALLRIGLGVLFAYAAAGKLADPLAFAEDLANYRLVPAVLVPAATTVVLGVELTAAALLILGVSTRAAAGVTAAMLVVFTVALVQALARGVNLSCGCFGGEAEPATLWTVMRDLAFLSAAVAVAVFDRGAFSAASDS